MRKSLSESERVWLGAQEPHWMEAGGVGKAERIAKEE
jgi:hypothetical protein